jgi:exo-1,4-beta-D-glucosaminidase
VKASLKTHETGEEAGGQVTVENTGTDIAFLVRLRLLKQKGEIEILPVFWEDNYFSLMPGEKRDVAVKVRKSDAGDAKLQLAVDGYNVSPVMIYAAQK